MYVPIKYVTFVLTEMHCIVIHVFTTNCVGYRRTLGNYYTKTLKVIPKIIDLGVQSII